MLRKPSFPTVLCCLPDSLSCFPSLSLDCWWVRCPESGRQHHQPPNLPDGGSGVRRDTERLAMRIRSRVSRGSGCERPDSTPGRGGEHAPSQSASQRTRRQPSVAFGFDGGQSAAWQAGAPGKGIGGMVKSGRRVNPALEFLDSGDNLVKLGHLSHNHPSHPVVVPLQGLGHCG